MKSANKSKICRQNLRKSMKLMKFFKFLILNFNAQFSRSHFPNKLEHADKKAEYLCTEKANYIV